MERLRGTYDHSWLSLLMRKQRLRGGWQHPAQSPPQGPCPSLTQCNLLFQTLASLALLSLAAVGPDSTSGSFQSGIGAIPGKAERAHCQPDPPAVAWAECGGAGGPAVPENHRECVFMGADPGQSRNRTWGPRSRRQKLGQGLWALEDKEMGIRLS